MAEYYEVAIMPARVRKPKDKNSTEASVGYVTRQIIARLRDEKFYSITELNARIKEEIKKLNDKEFQKREYSRSYVFENEEKDYLLALPQLPHEYATWKKANVSNNYHIQYERNYYSVPYQYINKSVDIRISKNTLEFYDDHTRIATHKRILLGLNQYVTNPEHMPDNHKSYGEWSKTKILELARCIGPNMYRVIENIFKNARIEQQVYNQCITLLKLKDKYSVSKLEAASEHILDNHITPIQKNFRMILENIQEKQAKEYDENNYALLRGANYYGGYRND